MDQFIYLVLINSPKIQSNTKLTRKFVSASIEFEINDTCKYVNAEYSGKLEVSGKFKRVSLSEFHSGRPRKDCS